MGAKETVRKRRRVQNRPCEEGGKTEEEGEISVASRPGRMLNDDLKMKFMKT